MESTNIADWRKSLAARRRAAGLSQVELARIARVSVGTVSGAERLAHNPSHRTCEAIDAAIDAHMESIRTSSASA